MITPTACLLIIGNEVLTGRTQDANLKFIATRLGGGSRYTYGQGLERSDVRGIVARIDVAAP